MSTLALLPPDITGSNPSNYIPDESRTLVLLNNRKSALVIPGRGAYFADSLEVYDSEGVLLTKGTDYIPIYLYEHLTSQLAKPLFGAILITNLNVGNSVRLYYQALGGPCSYNIQTLKDTLLFLNDVNQPIEWDKLVNRPRTYRPTSDHTHRWWQVYGLEYLTHQLSRVAHAIQVGDTSAMDQLEAYIDAQLKDTRDRLQAIRTQFEGHRLNTDNPHGDTKADVQLELVENLPMADDAQALNGTSENFYMSPYLVRLVMDDEAYGDLINHIADRNNPHNDTTVSVGVYSKGQVNTALNTKLGLDETAVNSDKLEGRSFTQIYDAARQNLSGFEISSGILDTDRLASGTQNDNYYLRGDGVWASLTNLFAQGGNQGQKVIYVRYQGSPQNAESHLNATYSSLASYPVGSIAFYWTQQQYGGNWNNDAGTKFDSLNAARRTADGWQALFSNHDSEFDRPVYPPAPPYESPSSR